MRTAQIQQLGSETISALYALLLYNLCPESKAMSRTKFHTAHEVSYGLEIMHVDPTSKQVTSVYY